MENKNITIIAMAVFSIILLINVEFIELVYALQVNVRQISGVVTTPNIFWGYASSKDYDIIYTGTGTTLQVRNANTLQSISNMTWDSNNSPVNDDGQFFKCSTTYCAYATKYNTPNSVRINVANLNSFTQTTYGNTTYANCDVSVPVLTGNSLYAHFSGATCGASGVLRGYKLISITNILDGDSSNNNNIIRNVTSPTILGNIAFVDACLSGGSRYIGINGANSNIYMWTLGSSVQDILSLGATPKNLFCIPNTSLVLVTSVTGNWVKLVSTANNGSVVSTTTITGANHALLHGVNVYVSKDGTTSLDVMEYKTSGTMIVSGTVVGVALGAILITGNSTRFNAVTNHPAGSAVINLFGISGLDSSDAGDEDTSTGNQIDGICGVGTALECIGDRSTINQITGGEDIKQVANSLLVGIGIVNGTNTDIQTNGTGLLLWLITGTFFAIALVGTIGKMNQRGYISVGVKDIDPIYWLFLVVAVTAIAFYLEWIPNIVFYGMIVGIASFFAFGMYRNIKSGG